MTPGDGGAINFRATAQQRLKADPYRTEVADLAKAIAPHQSVERAQLQRLALRALRPGRRDDEVQRVCATKVLAALLPGSQRAIRRLLQLTDGVGAYEVHFSLFCALSDLELDEVPKGQLLESIGEYLRHVKSETAMAAWMAGDLLGDHWIGDEALTVLLHAAEHACFAAGRCGGLHGLEHRMGNAGTVERGRLVAFFREIVKTDRSERVRSYARNARSGCRGMETG